MAALFLNNKYTAIYYQIITRAQNRTLSSTSSSEKHHIVPKSFYRSYCDDGWIEGDADIRSNLVSLTMKEHVICHRLLTHMTEGIARDKMNIAYWMMINGGHGRINSRTYELVRGRVKEAISKWSKIRWDDPSQREKMIAAQNRGKDTPEFRTAISAWSSEYYADPLHRARQSERVSTLWKTSEFREQVMKSLSIVWQDQELRALKSEQTVLQWQDQSYRKLMSEVRQKYWSDPENVEMCSARSTEIWADQNRRHEASERAQRRWADPEMRSKMLVDRGDQSVYMWKHEDGRTYTGTRKEFAEKHGFTRQQVDGCFKRTRPNKTCKGWRTFTSVNYPDF